jgi:hypothetical protein
MIITSKMKTTALDANECKIVWGFLLENTLFTEFEEHNHAIIETAYRQRKKKQASHYIVIVDANLPKPCKAKVYFGVVQNHLRMPGTRYYVARHVVRPNTTASTSNTVKSSSSLTPPPPLLMPSPMSTTSSSTSSSDTVYPPLHPSIAALFSDDPLFAPSTSTDSVNTSNNTSIGSSRTHCNNLLLDMPLGKSIPHSFNDSYRSFFNAYYGPTDVYNDQNNGHQFMNNNTEINNQISKVYTASNDGMNYLDQIPCQNNQDSVLLPKHQSNSNSQFNMKPIVKNPIASCSKRNRKPALDYSTYQHQGLCNYQSSSKNQQRDTTRNRVHNHNTHDTTRNTSSSSTKKQVESNINENNMIIGDMDWLFVWDFSSIDNASFQELISWPVFDVPKLSYSSANDYTF